MNLDCLLGGSTQVVILGAKGWLGRSAISEYINSGVDARFGNLLLLGSTNSTLEILGKKFQVHQADEALAKIKDNCILLNYAFLRRELTKTIDIDTYISTNRKLTSFVCEIISQKKLKSVVNSSSGVAKDVDLGSSTEIYSVLKREAEELIAKRCTMSGAQFINIRIFSLSGKFLNNFSDLALGNLLKQAKEGKHLTIKSPNSERTYVDAEQLNELIFYLISKESNIELDTGGSKVNFLELGNHIAKYFNVKVLVDSNSVPPNSYLGKYEKFNSIANSLGINLLNIDEQIQKTASALDN